MMKVLPTKIVVIDRTGVDQANREEPVSDWLSIPVLVGASILNGLIIFAIYAWCVKEGWIR